MSLFFPATEPALDSTPKLDLIEQAWEHIGDRYLARLKHNRIFAGRVRSILSLATYDALHSVINPGSGHIFKEPSHGSTVEAAAAAAVQAAHDILTTVFNSPEDQQDLADHLHESLSLFGNEPEKRIGIESGRRSAVSYIQTFSTLLTYRSVEKPFIRRVRAELVAA